MKKNISKHLLALATFLISLLTVFVVSFSVSAADYTSGDWTYTVSNNKTTITKYSGSATNITLPTTLGGYKVETIGSNAFENNTSIVSVKIPEGYVMIGNYAFRGCTYLNAVSIPKSIKSIGAQSYNGQSFSGCVRLETVTFAEGGTESAIICNNTFYGCTALKSVVIPANYETIGGGAFKDCTSLQTITIKENKDIYFVRTIEDDAFENCTSLTSVAIPEGFTKIGNYAFRGCTYLKTVSIPKSIKSIGAQSYNGQSFSGCVRLETVTFAEGGTESAIICNNTFYGCTALKSVVIPANYQTIGSSAFENCTSLSSVFIKDNADEYFERSLGQNAFKGCSNLTQIHIPAGFTSIGNYCFSNCSSKLVICSTTTDCAAKTYAKNNSITFTVCKGNHSFADEDTYTVNFYANGGSVTPASAKVIVGKSTTLPTPTKKVNITYNANGGTGTPSVQNCSLTCSGWSTSSSATTGAYFCGSSYTPTKDITLYAVWQKTTITLTSSVPQRGGYKFLGWSRDASATTASYSAGGKMNVTGNVTLYAVWEKYSEGDIDGYVIGVKADDVVINYKSANAMVPVIIEHSGDVDYTVEYSSSNSSVATVDNKGNITATGTGEAEITVTVTDEYGNTVEDTCTVTVSYAWWQWIIVILFFGWLWY